MKVCVIEDCRNKVDYKGGFGLCHKHYRRWQRTGLTTKKPVGTTEERLLENIRKRKKTGCWLWTGQRKRHGYGVIKIGGIETKTHRAMWEVVNGPIPDGLCVLHRCDVPPCCNPEHLFLGTQGDNVRDCCKKGRRQWLSQRAATRPCGGN